MNKEELYHNIERELFLNSYPSYDIDTLKDKSLLDSCEISNNQYESIITRWRKQLNISLDDMREFNSDIYKNTKKPKII